MKMLSDFPDLLVEYDWEKNTRSAYDYAASSKDKVWWICKKKQHSWDGRISNRTYNGDGCPYCSGRRVLVGENDLETVFPAIAKEFDRELNPKSPSAYHARSHIRVYWKCERGHSWKTPIYARTVLGTNCPFCSGRYPIPGETDFETVYPELAKEFDREKNTKNPSEYCQRSGARVWWKCQRGHSWITSILNRTVGKGCPYCGGKFPIPGENDLATLYPDLAKEFDQTKNKKGPHEYLPHSGVHVWWVCERKHSWNASIYSRTKGNGCPYCCGRLPIVGVNDFKTVAPEIADEFDLERNNKRPQDYTAQSHSKVWWKCRLKGHSWKAQIRSRVNGCGCPYCAGKKPFPGETDFATLEPELAKEFDLEKNRKGPQEYTLMSSSKVWWRCPLCNHSYRRSIVHRVEGIGCTQCHSKA